jgi:hypothetical protein
MSKPQMMLCTYRPTEGNEDGLLTLLKVHWAALHKAGLTTDEPAQIYRAKDKHTGRAYFVEIFSWRDEQAPGIAHQMPEVMAIWEPMGPMIVGGRGPELAVIEPVSGA